METKNITKEELQTIKREFLEQYSALCAKYGLYIIGFRDNMDEGEELKHIEAKAFVGQNGNEIRTVPEVLRDYLSQFKN